MSGMLRPVDCRRTDGVQFITSPSGFVRSMRDLRVNMSVCPLACLKNDVSNLLKFSVHVTSGRGSVLL